MKQIFCANCGTLVIEAATGSRIRKGTVCYCGKCSPPKMKTVSSEPPDFLKDLFGVRK